MARPALALSSQISFIFKFFYYFYYFPAAPSGPPPVVMGVYLLSEQRRLALVAEILGNCPSPNAYSKIWG
jgi:hypothetical protein